MKQVVYVTGMTCSVCDIHVKKALLKLKGVKDVKVERWRSRATIKADRQISVKRIKDALQDAGYGYSQTSEKFWSRSGRIWRDFVIGLLISIVVLFFLDFLGLFSFGNLLSGQDANYFDYKILLIALLLGVIASVSTCMALVGGIVFGVSASYNKAHPDASKRELMRPQFIFNAGRIIGFGLLGAVLGQIGSMLMFSEMFFWIMIALASFTMLFIGLRLTEISPKLSKLQISLLGRVGDASKEASQGKYNSIKPFLLGVASFFLPCGFTQTVQIFAFSMANPLWSGLVMVAFAIGTTPSLLGISLVSTFGNSMAGEKLFHIFGVVIVAFAFFNIGNVASIPLTASVKNFIANIGESSQNINSITSNVTYDGQQQVMQTDVVRGGYEPETTVIYAGVPTKWLINSKTFGCQSFLSLQSFGLGRVVATEDTSVQFTVNSLGTYAYACTMGMYTGKVVAIDKPSGSIEY